MNTGPHPRSFTLRPRRRRRRLRAVGRARRAGPPHRCRRRRGAARPAALRGRRRRRAARARPKRPGRAGGRRGETPCAHAGRGPSRTPTLPAAGRRGAAAPLGGRPRARPTTRVPPPTRRPSPSTATGLGGRALLDLGPADAEARDVSPASRHCAERRTGRRSPRRSARSRRWWSTASTAAGRGHRRTPSTSPTRCARARTPIVVRVFGTGLGALRDQHRARRDRRRGDLHRTASDSRCRTWSSRSGRRRRGYGGAVAAVPRAMNPAHRHGIRTKALQAR